MTRVGNEETNRELDELLVKPASELLHDWNLVGRLLLEYCKDDFFLLFHKLVEADPHGDAAERMPNLHNWSLLGWIVMNTSEVNRHSISVTILQARETLYRAISAQEILDMIRGRA